jgi:hypothetical protein
LGFIEGDGSFNFSHNRPAFSIKQKDRTILNLIGAYIQNISFLENSDSNTTVALMQQPCTQEADQNLASNFTIETVAFAATTITINKNLLVKPGKPNCTIRGNKIAYQLTPLRGFRFRCFIPIYIPFF